MGKVSTDVSCSCSCPCRRCGQSRERAFRCYLDLAKDMFGLSDTEKVCMFLYTELVRRGWNNDRRNKEVARETRIADVLVEP